MMDDISQMGKEIRRLTLALSLVVSGVSIFIFHGQFREIGIGIIIGALTGIIGFSMIMNLSRRIELYGNAKAKGSASYIQRYAIYMVVFLLAAYKGVNIIALFIGMLIHKGAILIYVFIHRKED